VTPREVTEAWGRERRYFMRISAPGWYGRLLSIDNATLPQVVDWFFSQLRPGVLGHLPEHFEVAFDEEQEPAG
jgi:hypothetical protein